MSSRAGWWAVVVGSSTYDPEQDELVDLPGVRGNVADLAVALSDPDLVGIPPSQVVSLSDPSDRSHVYEELARAARSADEMLLFYYAGHGVLDDQGGLHLALRGGGHRSLWKSIEARSVKQQLFHASHARSKVLVLDCCYSGRALDWMGDAESSVIAAIESATDVSGAVAIGAAPENSPAKAPLGQRHTAFTGAFLEQLRRGDPQVDAEWLDLETLFNRTQAALRRAGLPDPRIMRRENAHRVPFARNVARVPAPPPPPVEPTTTAPRGLVAAGPAAPPALTQDWAWSWTSPSPTARRRDAWDEPLEFVSVDALMAKVKREKEEREAEAWTPRRLIDHVGHIEATYVRAVRTRDVDEMRSTLLIRLRFAESDQDLVYHVRCQHPPPADGPAVEADPLDTPVRLERVVDAEAYGIDPPLVPIDATEEVHVRLVLTTDLGGLRATAVVEPLADDHPGFRDLVVEGRTPDSSGHETRHHF